MIKNLKGYFYSQQFEMTSLIEVLSKDATSAYELSMPLIASALQGDQEKYEKLLPRMKAALGMPSTSCDAWLLGRMLLAAHCMDAEIEGMRKQLVDILENKATPQDEYSAWSWGYLASLDDQQYKESKEKMWSATQKLTETYKRERSHKALSDVLWAWVMDLQAAANACDREMYDNILHQIQSVTQHPVAVVLSEHLKRTAASNDYPAWALAIARLSAARIRDEMLYQNLKGPLEISIANSSLAATPAEKVLATLTAVLAEYNHP